MLNTFLSYLLIILGTLAVTVGILGRFEFRGRVRFDLEGLWRFFLFVLGVILLVGAVVLYSYQAEVERQWNPSPLHSPTPTPTTGAAFSDPFAGVTRLTLPDNEIHHL